MIIMLAMKLGPGALYIIHILAQLVNAGEVCFFIYVMYLVTTVRDRREWYVCIAVTIVCKGELVKISDDSC